MLMQYGPPSVVEVLLSGTNNLILLRPRKFTSTNRFSTTSLTVYFHAEKYPSDYDRRSHWYAGLHRVLLQNFGAVVILFIETFQLARNERITGRFVLFVESKVIM